MISNIKIFLFLFVLLLLEITKPFGYTLSVDFLMLGIVFISLHKRFSTAFTLSIIFGFFRSTLVIGANLLTIMEYPIISFASYHLLSYFLAVGKKKYASLAKNLIALVAILIHIALGSAQTGVFLPFLALFSLVQSAFIYNLMSYILAKCNYLFLSKANA